MPPRTTFRNGCPGATRTRDPRLRTTVLCSMMRLCVLSGGPVGRLPGLAAARCRPGANVGRTRTAAISAAISMRIGGRLLRRTDGAAPAGWPSSRPAAVPPRCAGAWQSTPPAPASPPLPVGLQGPWPLLGAAPSPTVPRLAPWFFVRAMWCSHRPAAVDVAPDLSGGASPLSWRARRDAVPPDTRRPARNVRGLFFCTHGTIFGA